MLRLSSSLLLATLSLAACASAQESDNVHGHFVRKLQEDLPNNFFTPGSGICYNDTTVIFTEGFTEGFELAAFAPLYQPDCTCEEKSNQEVLEQLLEGGGPTNISEIDSFLEDFNMLLGQLEGSSEYNCINQCETCMDETKEVCAIVQTVQSYYFGLAAANFSFSDLASLSGGGGTGGNGTTGDGAGGLGGADATETFAQFVDELDFRYSVCLTYTKGGQGLKNGRVCLSVQIDENQDPTGDIACDLSNNGVKCDSCKVTQEGCIQATCSGDGSGEAIATTRNAFVIDTCAGTGFEGPFQFMEYLQKDANLTTITKGECGDFDVPPIELPAAKPRGDSETDPSSAPASASIIMAVIVGSIAAMFL